MPQLSELKEVTVQPLTRYHPLSGTVIVRPLYDANRIGRIYLPDGSQGQQSQIGIVVASGPRSPFNYPASVIYQQWTGSPFRFDGIEYLAVEDRYIIGYNTGTTFHPRKHWVLVEPDWHSAQSTHDILQKSGLFYPDSGVFTPPQPPFKGKVIGLGYDVVEVDLDDVVLFPSEGGIELAWIDRNLYLFHEEQLLAKLG